jgi:glycerol-3-phosphate acyltransferase PlsY
VNQTEIFRIAGGLVGAYLLGSIPASFLVARLGFGVDIRKVGSGNVGATNVFRSVGPAAGIVAAFFDIAKGTVAVWFGAALLPAGGPFGAMGFALACGAAAVFGHTFTVFLRFSGGKGVATAAGVFLALAPGPLCGSFVVFALTVAATRYVSLGSILAAVTLPLWIILTVNFTVKDRATLLSIASVLAVLIVWRHRSNISRLIAGTESRIGAGPAGGLGGRMSEAKGPPSDPAPTDRPEGV